MKRHVNNGLVLPPMPGNFEEESAFGALMYSAEAYEATVMMRLGVFFRAWGAWFMR